AMGIDQRRNRAVEFCLRERLDRQRMFPGPVVFDLPMLDGAAAADAEMPAERRDALRARYLDIEEAAAVGMMAGHVGDLDGLATERIGHIDRLGAGERDAVTAMADVIDEKTFNHAARRERIRRCRRRRGWRRGTPLCLRSRAKRQRKRY